jgi:hypothetical protein
MKMAETDLGRTIRRSNGSVAVAFRRAVNVPDAGCALAGAFGDPADRLAVRIGVQDGGGQLSAGSV